MEKLQRGLCIGTAFMLTVLFSLLGIFQKDSLSYNTALIGTILSALLLAMLFFISRIRAKRFMHRINAMPMQDRIEMTLSRKNAAEENIEYAAKRLQKALHIMIGYLLTLLALVSSAVFFCSALSESPGGLLILILLLAFNIYSGIMPFFFYRAPRFNESGYSVPEDYPTLYAMAYSAGKQLGITGEIRIVILQDCNAGIAKIGQVYSLQLGAELLYILNQRELEQILLHEFAHMTDPYIQKQAALPRYEAILESDSFFGLPLCSWLMAWPSAVYYFEKQLYLTAVSPLAEKYADHAVKGHGDLPAFASALAKVAMSDLFLAEFNRLMPEPYYQPENPRSDTCTAVCKALASAIESRDVAWMDMLKRELPPLVTSHPIFRQRLEAIGITELPIQITLPSESSPYRNDCLHAIAHMDKQILEMYSDENESRYREERKENYLKPLAIIEAWENSEKNGSAEDLRPIIDAYLTLNKFNDAEALCDIVIQNAESIYVKPYAMYVKGRCLLDRYDPDGIAFIYRAIDINHNFMDQGLDAIGSFCARTGRQKELKEYREKATELQQKNLDIYSNASEISIHDRLSYEQFPDDRLPKMLEFITNAGDGQIRCVFLVRKTITPNYFSSVFLIGFTNETEESKKEEIMEKIFYYLDTYPDGWQYSLFELEKSMEKKLRKKFPRALVFSLQHNE